VFPGYGRCHCGNQKAARKVVCAGFALRTAWEEEGESDQRNEAEYCARVNNRVERSKCFLIPYEVVSVEADSRGRSLTDWLRSFRHASR